MSDGATIGFGLFNVVWFLRGGSKISETDFALPASLWCLPIGVIEIEPTLWCPSNERSSLPNDDGKVEISKVDSLNLLLICCLKNLKNSWGKQRFLHWLDDFQFKTKVKKKALKIKSVKFTMV